MGYQNGLETPSYQSTAATNDLFLNLEDITSGTVDNPGMLVIESQHRLRAQMLKSVCTDSNRSWQSGNSVAMGLSSANLGGFNQFISQLQ